jgi:hypothetical protein
MSYAFPGLSDGSDELARDTSLKFNFSAFVPPLPAGCRRRHVVVRPLGPAATYMLQNTSAPSRVRFVLPPELGFVDPTSMYLAMTCANASTRTTAAVPAAPCPVHFLPGSLLRAVRLLCGGRVLEEITNYAEYNTFMMRTQKQNFLSYSGQILAGTGVTTDAMTLGAGGVRAYTVPLLTALTNFARTLVPLGLMTNSLWIELDWNSAAECVGVTAPADPLTAWLRQITVSNLELHFEALTFDDSFVSELRAASSVASVVLFTRTWTTFQAPLQAGQQRHLVLLPVKDPTHCLVHGEAAETLYNNTSGITRPSLTFTVNDSRDYQYQLGARMLPELPISGRWSAFWHLMRCLGIHQDPYREMPALNDASSTTVGTANAYWYGFSFAKTESDTAAIVGNAYPFDRSPEQLTLVLTKNGVANVASRLYTFACIDALFAINGAGVLTRVPVS